MLVRDLHGTLRSAVRTLMSSGTNMQPSRRGVTDRGFKRYARRLVLPGVGAGTVGLSYGTAGSNDSIR